jgi:glutamate synthase (NADPH/NADH) small chain
MGKPTGFMEFDRELPRDRSPLERVKDWQEFHDHFPISKLQEQGGRCMDCGIPFCHSGTLISGMASGCPINNNGYTKPTTSRNSRVECVPRRVRGRVSSA